MNRWPYRVKLPDWIFRLVLVGGAAYILYKLTVKAGELIVVPTDEEGPS